mmetsp:Transcript_67167/g.172957  ORF Transcript_67167/g.172957 Transcript_67167/m.172957 type:complete len:275 (+) Transcript_67167:78-902(+)
MASGRCLHQAPRRQGLQCRRLGLSEDRLAAAVPHRAALLGGHPLGYPGSGPGQEVGGLPCAKNGPGFRERIRVCSPEYVKLRVAHQSNALQDSERACDQGEVVWHLERHLIEHLVKVVGDALEVLGPALDIRARAHPLLEDTREGGQDLLPVRIRGQELQSHQVIEERIEVSADHVHQRCGHGIHAEVADLRHQAEVYENQTAIAHQKVPWVRIRVKGSYVQQLAEEALHAHWDQLAHRLWRAIRKPRPLYPLADHHTPRCERVIHLRHVDFAA